jgi:hypothetical protein
LALRILVLFHGSMMVWGCLVFGGTATAFAVTWIVAQARTDAWAGARGETTGKVTFRDETSAGGDDSGYVWMNRFEYEVEGEVYEVEVWDVEPHIRVGTEIHVEYAVEDPVIVRARDFDRRLKSGHHLENGPSWTPVWVTGGLTALLGLLLAMQLRDARRRLRRLVNGQLAVAERLSAQATTGDDNKPATRFVYEAQLGDEKQRIELTTRRTDLIDEAREPCLVGADGVAELLDAIPGAPRSDEGGRLVPTEKGWQALFFILPPVVAAAGLGCTLLTAALMGIVAVLP